MERPEPEDVDDVSTPPARPSTRARSRGPAARASRPNRSAGFASVVCSVDGDPHGTPTHWRITAGRRASRPSRR